MFQSTVRAIQIFFIWLFFIFVFDNALGIAAGKYGVLPGKPVYYYAVIAAGLLSTALLSRSPRDLMNARYFFTPLLILVVIGFAMYRSGPTPDFGGMTLLEEYIPKPISYAIWPCLNLLTAAALFLLARDNRNQILAAVFVTLVLQALTMEADMWWPAIFGDPNGRAGGLAQNANTAALMMVVLASLTLPTRKDEPANAKAVYALLIALAAVLLSQSKTGFIQCLILFGVFAFTKLRGPPKIAFVLPYLAILAVTAIASPVLHGTVEFPKPMHRGLEILPSRATEAPIPPSQHFAAPVATDSALSLANRIQSRASFDQSAGMRLEALRFYADILKDHWTGLGTGFTNKFLTGPHNSFLKLAADNGIIAALILAVLLTATIWRAIELRSPMLASLSLIALISATLSQTILVDPILIPAFGFALASAHDLLNDQNAGLR